MRFKTMSLGNVNCDRRRSRPCEHVADVFASTSLECGPVSRPLDVRHRDATSWPRYGAFACGTVDASRSPGFHFLSDGPAGSNNLGTPPRGRFLVRLPFWRKSVGSRHRCRLILGWYPTIDFQLLTSVARLFLAALFPLLTGYLL